MTRSAIVIHVYFNGYPRVTNYILAPTQMHSFFFILFSSLSQEAYFLSGASMNQEGEVYLNVYSYTLSV